MALNKHSGILALVVVIDDATKSLERSIPWIWESGFKYAVIIH